MAQRGVEKAFGIIPHHRRLGKFLPRYPRFGRPWMRLNSDILSRPRAAESPLERLLSLSLALCRVMPVRMCRCGTMWYVVYDVAVPPLLAATGYWLLVLTGPNSC